MKITIYELLGMIKDNKAPKKIWFNNNEWRLSGNDYYCDEEREYLFDISVVTDILNDKVEILETTITYKPDKIEKIDIDITEEAQFGINAKIIYKINELIDRWNNER